MLIRRRVVALVAGCVALAVMAACAVAYVEVRNELYGQIDDQLRGGRFFAAGPQPPQSTPRPVKVRDPGPRRGGPAGYIQFVSKTGTVHPLRGDLVLPVDAATRKIAAAEKGSTEPHTVHIKGVAVRMATFGVPTRGAVQVGRALDGTDRVLSRLRIALLFVLLAGVALAVLGARRVGGRFSGVLSQLEQSNAMLDNALRSQRQLVADASHELRTPVTSLRTNVEVLLEGDALDDESREQLLDDVREQTEELGALVADLIDLARGDVQAADPQEVRLDTLVAEAVQRARRHAARGVAFELAAAPVVVMGLPERLGRAINNLLDNAARHSPDDGVVEVVVNAAGVTVRDYGPGVEEDDSERLFDRFFRGADARSGTGTGLGLAIVRQVTETHGGSVSVANAADGGAIFRLQLPASSVPEVVR